ncbi:abc bile acid [Moniliophthora roreri]|nr:abc bile acid [Moniliophthora roreri]
MSNYWMSRNSSLVSIRTQVENSVATVMAESEIAEYVAQKLPSRITMALGPTLVHDEKAAIIEQFQRLDQEIQATFRKNFGFVRPLPFKDQIIR